MTVTYHGMLARPEASKPALAWKPFSEMGAAMDPLGDALEYVTVNLPILVMPRNRGGRVGRRG